MQTLLEKFVYKILDSLILTFFRAIQSHGHENIPKEGPGNIFYFFTLTYTFLS